MARVRLPPPPLKFRALALAFLIWCPAGALSACGDNLAPPPDAPEIDAPADAAPADAPPDASQCWAYEIVQCHGELIQLCVPRQGCAFYTCDGQSYGYCGPQN